MNEKDFFDTQNKLIIFIVLRINFIYVVSEVRSDETEKMPSAEAKPRRTFL